MSAYKKDKTQVLNLRIDAATAKRLESLAAAEDVQKSNLARRALTIGLDHLEFMSEFSSDNPVDGPDMTQPIYKNRYEVPEAA